MSDQRVSVRPATPNNLLRAWRETGINMPGAELWPPAVERRTNDVLIARLGGKAVGSVCIMWNGPTRHDTAFRQVLETAYPDQHIPAAYGLEVNSDHWGKGIGKLLMEGVETEVLKHPEVAHKIALTVEVENDPAVAIYRELGYEQLETIIVDAPRFNPKTNEFDHADVESFVMLKDLDE